jgi:nicotinamidase-related amidase
LKQLNILLVVDMQNAWLDNDTPRYEKELVIARINRAAEAIRAQGGQVIYIQHCNQECPQGSTAWQVHGGLLITSDDRFIDKTACDAFVDTCLLQTLRDAEPETLFICGLATEFCVDTTVRAALSHRFKVAVLADAHTTGDRPHLSGQQIVEHHNWTWKNMELPHGSSIRVMNVAEVF